MSKERPELKIPTSPSRGDQRVFAGVFLTGLVLGGILTQEITRVLLATSGFSEAQKDLFTQLGATPGAAIFGLIIPVDIYRRTFRRSWTDIWNKINS